MMEVTIGKNKKVKYDKWVVTYQYDHQPSGWEYHHKHGNFEIILEIFHSTFYDEYQVTLGLKWKDKMIADVDNEEKNIGAATKLPDAKELAIATMSEFLEDLK